MRYGPAVKANLHGSDWDEPEPDPGPAALGFGARWGRMVEGDLLDASLWELPPGLQGCPYHTHRANEELLIVVSGRPTLRGPDGNRTLEPGDIVLFPRGPEGAHALINETDEPCRYLMASSRFYPEVAEYPDSGKLNAYGGPQGDAPGQKFLIADAVDYWVGEDRRSAP